THVPVKSLVAQVETGPDAGQRATGDAIAIGTADGSALRLTDPAVSRFHAELRAAPGGALVIDHGSTNGTWAGAIRIERGVVPAGGPAPAAPEGCAADVGLPYKEARAQLLDQFEARYLEALLARASGNVSAAARIAQMTRSHLTELIAKHRKA